jgi:hypothetical protein
MIFQKLLGSLGASALCSVSPGLLPPPFTCAKRTHAQAPRVILRAAVLTALAAMLATAAGAMTIRELRALEVSDKKQGEAYVNYYLVGVMEGALEAHAHGVRNGAKPQVCVNGRKLEPRMARGLYDTELQRNAGVYEADMPVPLVMANALGTVYPC